MCGGFSCIKQALSYYTGRHMVPEARECYGCRSPPGAKLWKWALSVSEMGSCDSRIRLQWRTAKLPTSRCDEMSGPALPVIDELETSVIDTRALTEALKSSISTRDVRCDRVSRALYATDASVYQIIPLLVAFPATAADI